MPDDVLKQRYGDSIHYEVLNELIQESYPKELQEQNIKPASSPAISIENEDSTKPISYSAVFEVHQRSEEHTSELQSHHDLVCRLLLEKKKNSPMTFSK